MVTTFYPPHNFGGDGIFVYRLSNELARRGHSVDVVYCRDAYNLLVKKAFNGSYPNHPNVSVHPLQSALGFLSPLLTQQTGRAVLKNRKIRQLIEQNSYDVIHFHNMSLIGLDVLAYGDAVKLYTMHEYWLVCPMHYLWKNGSRVCDSKSCIRCQLNGKRPLQLWRYGRTFARYLPHVDAFIAPSETVIRKHREFGLSYPMVHLPNFVAAETMGSPAPAVQHNTQTRPYFLFVGRLEKVKGLQNLLHVFRRLQHCDLIVAGDGTYGHELKGQMQDISNVRYLGHVSNRQLRKLYQNAIAVIVPSICFEVFGLVVIEAFAAGTPVIVNNIGALPELVRKSGGGLVYSKLNELVGHIERLLVNPDLRAKLAERGYQAYHRFWTEKHHVHNYLALILKTAAQKGLRNPRFAALEAELRQKTQKELSDASGPR